MPWLVQFCIVIVTVAFVAIVVTTIRTLLRVGDAAVRLTSAAQVSMVQVDQVVVETHELLVAVNEILPPTQRVLNRLQRLGDRAANLSGAIIDEIEQPVFTAVAVARGVKTGTNLLLNLLNRRFAHPRLSTNGEHDHE